MSTGQQSPADLIKEVYGIALAAAVAQRVNVAVMRTVARAAPLLRQQPCEFDGFRIKDPGNNVA